MMGVNASMAEIGAMSVTLQIIGAVSMTADVTASLLFDSGMTDTIEVTLDEVGRIRFAMEEF